MLPVDARGSNAGTPPGAGDLAGLGAQVAEIAAQLSALQTSLSAPQPPSGTSGSARTAIDVEAGGGIAGAGASPSVVGALDASYARHERNRRLMSGAGLGGADFNVPEEMDLVSDARASALRMAGARVTWNQDGSEEDEVDRGFGAQAELPPGVAEYPPRVFAASACTYAKGWHKFLLRQDEPRRSETDPRIKEGETLSNAMLWMDYSELCKRLARTAREHGEWGLALDLREIQDEYSAVVYEALRRRVDDVSLNLVSAPVAEIMHRESRMELETVNMRPEAVHRIRDFNKATNVARTKAAAAKAATGSTVGSLVGADLDSDGKAAAAKKAAQKKKDADARKASEARKAAAEKAGKEKPSKTQTPPAPAETSADTGNGRRPAAGGA